MRARPGTPREEAELVFARFLHVWRDQLRFEGDRMLVSDGEGGWARLLLTPEMLAPFVEGYEESGEYLWGGDRVADAVKLMSVHLDETLATRKPGEDGLELRESGFWFRDVALEAAGGEATPPTNFRERLRSALWAIDPAGVADLEGFEDEYDGLASIATVMLERGVPANDVAQQLVTILERDWGLTLDAEWVAAAARHFEAVRDA